MLYYLRENIDEEPLMILEADSVKDAWKQARSAGIRNRSNNLTIEEVCENA
jgi:hypothetical protein